ncbi:MAG: HlyC/CorC family transporter [Calditrichaeota bacterium]|nr:HlyC/CorC family transporter [Calditrichota bacterium]MCB0292204.1 HlyC/CorC family transporter [Calditrichota bacterium]MCB0294811.1 HlyC/CorC family transporter [Calditrichota bacterium]MCB0304401.1 HlyC/CorC family transporter [Calditrichota bacterium]
MVDLTIIIVSLLMSFFFSGAETAFVSVNKVRVEVWRRHRERFANILLDFVKNPEKFIYTTLIGNNIFNVAFASFATIYFNTYLRPEVTLVLLILVTLMIGEIIPKTVARSLSDVVVRKIVFPLRFFFLLFKPLIWLVSRISESLLTLIGYQRDELRLFFSDKDIKILLTESQNMVKQNDPVEGEVLSGILNLKELWVRDAMVPRTEIIAVPDTVSLDEVKKVFKKYGFTRLPVYHKALDNIVGVVYLKDLFLEPNTVKEMVRQVMFVPESKRCSELLKDFRENNVSIAVVIDEYGGTAGLITTEDLVEELFGEIEDEDDEQEVMYRQIDEKTYRVNARIEFDKLNELFDNRFPEGEYETLAGFLLAHLGHIPRRDETLEFGDLKMTVTSATRLKIQWVKIRVN